MAKDAWVAEAISKNEGTAGPSRDYHDYVFRNRKLLGDFDGMYRHSKDIPWHQDQASEAWYSQVGMLMMLQYAPYSSVLEIGCGMGYLAASIKGRLDRNGSGGGPGVFEAFDISEEAVHRARLEHPGIDFYVGNIRDDCFKPRRRYDLVVMKDVFWYVLDRLDVVLDNLDRCVKPGGRAWICQTFPPLDSPFVGKEVFPDPLSLIHRLSSFEVVHSAVLVNHREPGDGPILNVLVRKTSGKSEGGR